MIEQEINNILIKWNPLDVPDYIAEDEYKSYIPKLIELKNNSEQLHAYLESFVADVFGFDSRPDLIRHDIDNIVFQISRL